MGRTSSLEKGILALSKRVSGMDEALRLLLDDLQREGILPSETIRRARFELQEGVYQADRQLQEPE